MNPTAALSSLPSLGTTLAAVALATMTAPDTARAQLISTLFDSLDACEAGTGGIGPIIGNVGALDTPRDVGFAFTVPLGPDREITDVTVCVDASNGAYVAPFALFADDGGAPGAQIDTFGVFLGEQKGFSSALADAGAVLEGGATYWLVAMRSAARGTWFRVGDDTLGMQADRQGDDPTWVLSERVVVQMRIRALPEPGALLGLAALTTLAALRRTLTP